VAAGFGFFGAEGRSKAVDFAERGDVRLVIKLAGLRQVGGFAVIVDLKERGRIFSGGPRQDRRIDQDVTVTVQPVTDGADDRGADAQDRPLSQRPYPQMPVIHQKFNTVFLRLDRVFRRDLNRLNMFDADLVPAGVTGCAFVGPHGAGYDQRGFLG
jgi:hypothetical protein